MIPSALRSAIFSTTASKILNGEIYSAPFVLNATYAGINIIHDFLGFEYLPIKYEFCEVILCEVSENIKNVGLTVMDGPFFSLMPFGLTGYHSITTVSRTPHFTSYDKLPPYDCGGDKEYTNIEEHKKVQKDSPYLMQVSSSGPDTIWTTLKYTYSKLIGSAKKEILIQSPYFVPDTDLISQLKMVGATLFIATLKAYPLAVNSLLQSRRNTLQIFSKK